MTLIVLSVVVIVLLVAVLAIYLFTIGVLLNRVADNLGDSLYNLKTIRYQAKVIGPGVVRINEAGVALVGALPLLCEGADGVAAAKSSPSAPSAAPAAPAAPRGLGYLDAV